MNDPIAQTIIYMPVFNREAIARESIQNMREVKGNAHLAIIDDASTEFDGSKIVALGDSGRVNEKNRGIDDNRMKMLMDFLTSDFRYCYFTDSDTLHDPSFLARALDMFDKTRCVCSLYNTRSPKHHKDGWNLDIGEEILIRRTVPGISMFFDKPLAMRVAQHYLDGMRFRPTVVAEMRAWDWYFCSVLPQMALSRVSYLEHLFVGGLHADIPDLADNLTPVLQAARRPVFERLGIPLEEG